MIAAAFALALMTTPAPPIAGGYQKVSVKAKDVRAAARFAVKSAPEPSRLSWILDAQNQVVAGINYKLCLVVKPARAGFFSSEGHLFEAIVYRDLQQSYHLTSWTKVESCHIGI